MPDRRDDPKFSVEQEPWLQDGGFQRDLAEAHAAPTGTTGELDQIRDSVFNEPTRQQAGASTSAFTAWMKGKICATTRLDSLAVTFVAAVAGGLFSVIGALVSGRQTGLAIIYIVLFGPVTEELLKQAGMIFLLERRPYRIFSRWQLVFGAVLSALLFASLENLLYQHLYWFHMPHGQLALMRAFRWKVCTSLHIAASLVASMGLVHVWQRMWDDGKPADLSAAYPYFAVAIAIHGVYNLIAVMTHSIIFF